LNSHLRWSPRLARVKEHDARYAAYGALTRALWTHIDISSLAVYNRSPWQPFGCCCCCWRWC